MGGVMGSRLYPEPLPKSWVRKSGKLTYVRTIADPVSTTNATPVVALSVPIPNGGSVSMRIEGTATQADGSNVFEFRYRNVFRRSGGTSARAGSAGGTGDSAANTFAVARPSVTFLDPAVTNTADVQIIGKAGTAITWSFVTTYTITDP